MTFNALDYFNLEVDDMAACVLLTIRSNWNQWLKKCVILEELH